MNAWLTPPYYLPQQVVRAFDPATGTYPPTAETSMQDVVYQNLSWPPGFIFGYSSKQTPNQFFNELLAFAIQLTQYRYSPFTCVGFDPVARTSYFVNLIFDALKRIPASNWLPFETRSVYDVWISLPKG